MHFSCKISNSVLTFCDRRGADLDFLFDLYDIPIEQLRDSSAWLEAEKMERFLRMAEHRFEALAPEESFLSCIGHRVAELRSWGVLDSVFRMMQKPQDVFLQPGRLFSYFISPEPPVELIQRSADRLKWRLPVSSYQFPKTTEYLRAAFEALPSYVGRAHCQVEWIDSSITVAWAEKQESLVVEEPQNLNPNLVQAIVKDLEKAQKDLEDRTKELADLKEQIARMQKSETAPKLEVPVRPEVAGFALLNAQFIEPQGKEQTATLSNNLGSNVELSLQPSLLQNLELDQAAISKLDKALQQVYRYNDYMVRAQQLITLLIGTNRQQPQIREAIRRTDWEFVRSEYAHVAKEIVNLLQNVKSQTKNSLSEERRDTRAHPNI